MQKYDPQEFKGLIALVLLALIYGLTGIMARYFTAHFGVFEQWYLRFFIATVITVIVFRRHIDYKKYLRISKKEWLVTVVRGLVEFVIAAWLYALSTHYTTIGSVAAMQILPFTAVFGLTLFRERVSKMMFGLIILSFVGAAIVALHDIGRFQFGVGELMSLVAGALFSLTLVLRKKQTGELNNHELVLGVTVTAFVGNYVLNLASGGPWLPHTAGIPPVVWWLLIVAGALSALMSLLANYGFEHVRATTASIILDLELVFGVMFGFVLYRETLTAQQAVGALIILGASSAVAYGEAKQLGLQATSPPKDS